jgi:hypothetical protein
VVRATLDVVRATGRLLATVRERSGLLPSRPADMAGILFVESNLAGLSGLWQPPPRYNWPEGLARWLACPVPERCERVAAGFGSWCRAVAGVEAPA